MMKKIAFIYGGQGSQFVGMGKEFFLDQQNKEIIKIANDILGYDILTVLFDENKINETIYTQPLLYILEVLISKRLEENGVISTSVAGLSLGEYAALTNASCFNYQTGIYLLKERARLMSDSAKKNKGMMMAIIGLAEKEIEKICDLIKNCQIANYNTVNQIVISGEETSVKKAGLLAKEKGAKRVIPLNTEGAFHSYLMQEAQDKYEDIVRSVQISTPRKNLYMNVTGKKTTKNLEKMMINQITSPVRFTQTIKEMIASGVTTFIEISPKKTLSSFVKKIDKQINIMHVCDKKSLQDTLNKLGVHNDIFRKNCCDYRS